VAAADTIYAARFSGPETLVKGRANLVTCPLYRDGAVVAPASSGSTLTVLRPDGTALVDAQAVTVTGSVAQYSIGSSVLAAEPYREGYSVEWSLVVAGTTHRFRRSGAVCRSQLYPVVTDLDLIRRHSDLASQRPASLGSYQAQLDEAWADLTDDLRLQGNLPHRILSSEDLRRVHMFRALVIIFRDFRVGGQEAKWADLQAEYEDLARKAFDGLSVVYDRDEDGTGGEVRRPAHATTFFAESTTPPLRSPWGR
jgi:hypothetical protein